MSNWIAFNGNVVDIDDANGAFVQEINTTPITYVGVVKSADNNNVRVTQVYANSSDAFSALVRVLRADDVTADA